MSSYVLGALSHYRHNAFFKFIGQKLIFENFIIWVYRRFKLTGESNSKINVIKSIATIRRILILASPYRKHFFVVFILIGLTAATEPALVWSAKYIVDYGFEGIDGKFPLIFLPIGLTLIYALRGSANFATGYLMMWVSSLVLTRMQREVYESILRAKLHSDEETLGRAINAVTTEGRVALDIIERVIAKFVRNSFTFLSLLISVMQIHLSIGLILATVIFPFIYVVHALGVRYHRSVVNYVQANSRLAEATEDTLAKFSLVRQYEAGEIEARHLDRFISNVNASFRSMATRSGLIVPVSQTIIGLYAAALYWIRPQLTDSLTDGGFLAINTALLLMLSPLKEIAAANSAMLRSIGAATSVFASVDISRESTGHLKLCGTIPPSIEFNDVAIKYQGNVLLAIDSLSFSIQPGEILALIGPSGSGKTSILNVIAGLLIPQNGTVRIGDICLNKINLISLRSNIAYVGQKVQMLDGSLKYNICYGDACPSLERMWNALAVVGLEGFVRELPYAESTLIGVSGISLSGGQQQLLSIARAIYRDTPIVLLDEPTSALDRDSEIRLVRHLKTFLKGRTVVVATNNDVIISLATQILSIDGFCGLPMPMPMPMPNLKAEHSAVGAI